MSVGVFTNVCDSAKNQIRFAAHVCMKREHLNCLCPTVVCVLTTLGLMKALEILTNNGLNKQRSRIHTFSIAQQVAIENTVS